jgi:hypothetical protein
VESRGRCQKSLLSTRTPQPCTKQTAQHTNHSSKACEPCNLAFAVLVRAAVLGLPCVTQVQLARNSTPRRMSSMVSYSVVAASRQWFPAGASAVEDDRIAR